MRLVTEKCEEHTVAEDGSTERENTFTALRPDYLSWAHVMYESKILWYQN